MRTLVIFKTKKEREILIYLCKYSIVILSSPLIPLNIKDGKMIFLVLAIFSFIQVKNRYSIPNRERNSFHP